MILVSTQGRYWFLILSKAFLLHIINEITCPPGQEQEISSIIFLTFTLHSCIQIRRFFLYKWCLNKVNVLSLNDHSWGYYSRHYWIVKISYGSFFKFTLREKTREKAFGLGCGKGGLNCLPVRPDAVWSPSCSYPQSPSSSPSPGPVNKKG